MGGYGSGARSHRQKAEHIKSLDVNRLHREGCLSPGNSGYRAWFRENEETGRIAYHANERHLNLAYNARFEGGDWETITQSITLIQAPCPYGGTRPYFICNGISESQPCQRRVAKLFAGGRYFLCRHCYNISYASQSETRYDRMLRRANNLRTSLGGEPGTLKPIAPKPKGMWERTYQRKCFEIKWCEIQANQHLFREFSQFLRFNREEPEPTTGKKAK